MNLSLSDLARYRDFAKTCEAEYANSDNPRRINKMLAGAGEIIEALVREFEAALAASGTCEHGETKGHVVPGIGTDVAGWSGGYGKWCNGPASGTEPTREQRIQIVAQLLPTRVYGRKSNEDVAEDIVDALFRAEAKPTCRHGKTYAHEAFVETGTTLVGNQKQIRGVMEWCAGPSAEAKPTCDEQCDQHNGNHTDACEARYNAAEAASAKPVWATFMEWYQGERGDAAMGAIKFGEHPKDSRAALECAWHDAREIQTTVRTDPGEESEREKNIRNAAFKRGLRTAKLDHARRFFESFEHVREAFDVWRNRARSAEGKLKAALRMLGMTEHELDQALERVTAPDGPG